MNDVTSTQDNSSENQYEVGTTVEELTIDHGISFAKSLSNNAVGESQKPQQQKFKSKHFPEPYWGMED